MRLSTVFELLVIALLIAFAASRVIDGPDRSKTLSREHHRFSAGRQSQESPSRHCTCSSFTCNCCRDFSLPIVPIKGPGCATVQYLRDDAMMITMSFGDKVVRNITVDSKKPKPICMNMPGGISKFCGRLYNIKKEGDDFKACLGLELRALDDVEAALRVSCFKFGTGGVNVEPGEAVPALEKSTEDEEDEDDDDYGLGALDDDDDDDDGFGLTGGEDDDDDEERPPAKDTYNYVDSSDSDSDYTGLSSLSEELFGGLFGSSSKKRKPVKAADDVYTYNPSTIQHEPQQQPQAALPQVNLVVMQPVILPTAKPLRKASQKKPTRKPTTVATTATTATTTPAPKKKKNKTTPAPAPVRTLPPSTTPSVAPSNTPPLKNKKKKKKPSRRRNPSTPKPTNKNSTDGNPTVITSTTMTVQVVQGGVELNSTESQQIESATFNAPVKIPMTKPVLETILVEPVRQSNGDKNENIPQADSLSSFTDRAVIEESESTEGIESTTQTIMQNTIPTDENLNDGINLIIDRLTVKTPYEQQNNEYGADNLINTTPNLWYPVEETTNQETTKQEELSSYTNNFENIMINPESATSVSETTETTSDTTYDTTPGVLINNQDGEDVKAETLGTELENIESTQSLRSSTVSYDMMEEGTDKTEPILHHIISTQESTKEEESESDDSDDEDDDDDSGIDDLGADLGLEDDDEEQEDEKETNQKITSVSLKPEEKEDDDYDDFLGDLMDDDDDTKTKGEERALPSNAEYRINPLLYRIARVSTGSIATARHLPRYSDGRNRRNNKRMRFPSLELTP